jgi:hypothetical protein
VSKEEMNEEELQTMLLLGQELDVIETKVD